MGNTLFWVPDLNGRLFSCDAYIHLVTTVSNQKVPWILKSQTLETSLLNKLQGHRTIILLICRAHNLLFTYESRLLIHARVTSLLQTRALHKKALSLPKDSILDDQDHVSQNRFSCKRYFMRTKTCNIRRTCIHEK